MTGVDNNIRLDYSAINYCVESYIITSFINTLDGLETPANCECGYNHSNNPLKISPANDPENLESDFCIHKRGIIKNVVESNLNQAITSYSRNNASGEYKLPKLTETDWDQVLTNVSIITFIQNIPIGMKYYNNYAIATSTVNKEYVDPDEIYLNASDGEDSEYYHTPYCEKLGESDLKGYRSIDYVQKSYTENDETKYYYRHSNAGDAIEANQACYYCLVQRSLYNEDKTFLKRKAYNTALARERYVARMSRLPAEIESVIEILGVSDTVGTGMIYIKKDDEVVSGISAISKKITKSDVGKTFEIYGESNSISAVSGEEMDASNTSLSNPAKVAKEALRNRACYTTDDRINVTIAEYNNRGVSIVYRPNGGSPAYGAGDSKEIFGGQTFIPSDVGTGFINVKLHYKTNYTVGADKRVEVWANINDYDNLTIAVKPIDITGRLRLEFTDGTNTYYYSENTFNVENGDEIFCNIPSDTMWYGKNWHVNVLNVDNKIIATGRVEYYTINDATGLKGFSDAVNGTKGPEGGATTLRRTFKVINNITNVGELAPIAGVKKPGNDNWNKIWFEGTFQGQNYTISGITMSYTDDETYNALGLFGWVGKNASISDLKVGINVASFTNSNPKKNGTNRICIGGIVGYTDGQINNCTIMSSSNIGAGQIKVNSGVLDLTKDDIYCVGGIAGYANGATNQCKLENNVKVRGGKIEHSNSSKLEEHLKTYAGGLIGYKEIKQEINDSFSANCSVEGYDNVGGIIGFNAGGDINNVSFKGSITGSGENIGGIVGCNTGGNIYNCTNTVNINVKGENVGGIAGSNYNNSIINCNNNALIKGKQNVGGIAGITYSTTIKSCKNFGNIEAEEGFGPDYWIMWKVYRGTGGIAGKLCTSTVEQSFNSGNVKSTVNVGGIAGLNWCSKVYYSYNKGNIEATSASGQVGGICGHGSGADILGCYNIGSIKGKKDIAGIMGSCINDTTYPNIDVEKYKDKYLYLDFTPGEIHNYFKYCYNAGKITDTSSIDSSAGILGKRMLGFNDISMSITFVECYFLDNVKQEGYKAPAIDKKDSNIHKMSEEELKKQLYIWASNDAGKGGLFINDNYMYNTITPLETDKGYEGYGVLWWQLEDYIRLTTNMFLCQISKTDGIEEKNYKEISLAYKPSVEFNGNSLTFREIPFDCKIINPFPEDKPVSCNSCLQWKMMIKNIDYVVEGKTDFSKEADYFVDNDFKIRGKTMNLSTGTDKTISIAPVIETVADNLETKSISTVWKRENIDIITARGTFSWPSSANWGLYDENHELIKSVKGYYELDPNDSKETFNDGKHVTIIMDKGDEIVSNQPVKFYKFEYYTRTKKYNWKKVRWDYYYHGPNQVSEGTNADDVKPKAITYEAKFKVVKQADKAACNVYIPVQNLVDRIGEETARKNVLQTAKLNMEFKARLKTALLQKNISHLTAKVTLERKEKGTDNWIKVDEHINNGFTADSKKKRPFGDDYTEFDADLQKLKISDWNLKDVKYNDDLRINVDLEFKGTTEKAYIDIKNVNLDITYGPDIDEDE